MGREELLKRKEELEQELVRITRTLILNMDMVKVYEELEKIKKELEKFQEGEE